MTTASHPVLLVGSLYSVIVNRKHEKCARCQKPFGSTDYNTEIYSKDKPIHRAYYHLECAKLVNLI